MDEPVWLSRLIVDTIHRELIAEHGGAPGIRAGGENLVESALARPRQRFAYAGEADLPTLAAAYLFGLTKNHGYVDGNKRVGFAAAATFLLINGLRLEASEQEAYDAVIRVVEGGMDETELSGWFRERSQRVDRGR